MKANDALKAAAALLLLVLLLSIITQAQWPTEQSEPTGIKDVGLTMFNEYQLPFVLLSLVLFTAMLGAVYLAKERDE